MNRKGVLGQALTSPIVMIIVFLLMLVFVIISGFMAKNHENSYSLREDFLNDYIIYEGKIITVNDFFYKFLSIWVPGRAEVRDEFNKVLKGHFLNKYGPNNHFVMVHHFMVDQRIYLSSFSENEFEVDEDGDLYITGDNGVEKFNLFFDTSLDNVEKYYLSGDDILYLRRER